MHKYLSGIIDNLKGKSVIVGGTEDHIHILCIMPKELSLADFVRALKANSSKWFRQNCLDKFSWQTGYGAFAVSKSVFPIVVEYIANQEEHHKKQDFNEEFRKLVESHGLVYEAPKDEDD